MRIVPFVLCLMITLPAAASDASRAAYARFKGLDSDGDRALDRREIVGARGAEALFVMLDADGDGRLALKEVEGAGGGGRVARFDAYDTNKDGFVARREFPTKPDPRLFAALDRDGDRRLALAEIRPGFAGYRPHAISGADSGRPAKRARTTESARTWCWVPAFGDDGWGLEAPVLWSGCRTTGQP